MGLLFYSSVLFLYYVLWVIAMVSPFLRWCSTNSIYSLLLMRIIHCTTCFLLENGQLKYLLYSFLSFLPLLEHLSAWSW